MPDRAWNPIEKPQDCILLGGRKSPGLCDIEGAELVRRLQVNKLYGQSGAVVRYFGDELARFSVKLRLYTPQDWDDWIDWSDLIFKPPARRGGRIKDSSETAFLGTGAYDIVHPLLADLGIDAVIVESVSQPDQTDDGEWTITIKMLQYRAPAPALAVPKGPQASPAENDPAQLEIGKLHAQVQSLAGPP
jgi:hypothetical protein